MVCILGEDEDRSRLIHIEDPKTETVPKWCSKTSGQGRAPGRLHPFPVALLHPARAALTLVQSPVLSVGC